ncbi:MAG: Fic family protein [Selenomonadaceae bacterium]|nr:Fic family protein [Selenomonadaceae bacterium]
MTTYERLGKIFYKDSLRYGQIYHERFNAQTTRHFDFSIKQFKHKKEFPAFFCYTEDLMLLIEKIYAEYESFLRVLNTVPPIVLTQFNLWCVVDEIKSSNAIEGVNSTRRELSETLEGISKTPKFATIVKQYHALTCGEIFSFKSCADLRIFYDDFIHAEIINANPNNKLDGKIFRKDSVDITSGTQKTLHRGSYPEEKIVSDIEVALNILNDENIPFLVRVSVFHYLFGYIHPFYDGNGRTSRFITSYFLAEQFHYLPALRLSLMIKRNRKKYYELFEDTTAEINCGDLTPFVQGFMEIISETFTETESILKRKLSQLEKYRQILMPLIPQDALSQQIYEILLQSGAFFGQGVSMEDLMKFTGKSRNTIKSRFKSAPNGHIISTGDKKIFYKLNSTIFKR